ncbi:MAG TPA: bacteriohopanetetrol glucosamine biosynthesis glycosyltransferase HpnI [Stellaceae bacterium]|nr:bacteriohopanetetrol glucosamine biosynthesis glycosyltransferase HpnI [Stellaceae bacterium]
MSDSFLMLLSNALLACAAAGTVYLLVTPIAVRNFVRRHGVSRGAEPPVTILKPLCGDEPELYENLRSFCRQRYPRYQLVFGVQNPRDPAVALVKRLIQEFPKEDIHLVTEPNWPAAGNRKVANLAGMLPAARHDLLVMADADIRVGSEYLSGVVASLSQPDVGLVTCLYRGRAVKGFWSKLAGLHIDHEFLPQAILGEALSIGDGCFGATIALRRGTLDAIGGFAAISDRLADDHALGEAVRSLGLRVLLAPYLVDTVVAQPGMSALLRQELRWALTVRALAPMGYLGTLVTYPLMLALLANLISGFGTSAVAMLSCTLVCRVLTGRVIDRQLGHAAAAPWMLPLRDVLSFWVFAASFFIRTVAWRGQRLRVGSRSHPV